MRVIVGVLTAPLSALAASVLYFELRGARAAGSSPGGGELSGPAAPGPDSADVGGGSGTGGSDAERAFGG